MEERWKIFGTTNASNPKRTMNGQRNDGELERYWYISDHGRVKVTTNYNEAIKWPKLSLTGGQAKQYLAISNNNLIEKYVHRLVARFFISPPPDDGQRWTVDHINGNKLDNHYTNLEWVSYKENIRRYWEARREAEANTDEEYISMAQEVTRTLPRQERDAKVLRLYHEGWTQKAIKEQLGLTTYQVNAAVSVWRKANNINTRNTRK